MNVTHISLLSNKDKTVEVNEVRKPTYSEGDRAVLLNRDMQ